MFAILLPVKEFRHSKQRLSAWLTPPERESLAQAMFEDVWTTLRSSFFRDRLMVISSEAFVIERCRRESVPFHSESASRSHSDSVAEATRWAVSRGITSLLSIAIDTPALATEDIVKLQELSQHFGVVIVPSADGTGTNALLRTPPESISPQFGPESCELHVEQAKSKGLSHTVFPVASLAADIDTLEDAERFLSLNHTCRTAALLREWLTNRPEIRRGVAICS